MCFDWCLVYPPQGQTIMANRPMSLYGMCYWPITLWRHVRSYRKKNMKGRSGGVEGPSLSTNNQQPMGNISFFLFSYLSSQFVGVWFSWNNRTILRLHIFVRTKCSVCSYSHPFDSIHSTCTPIVPQKWGIQSIRYLRYSLSSLLAIFVTPIGPFVYSIYIT